MASTHTTAETVGPKQAAAALGLSEKGLRQAIKAKRVPAERVPRGAGFMDRMRLDELRHALATLERCRMPGCNRPALCENGGCGALGHGQSARTRSPEVGKRISRAKKGRALVARHPSEITLKQAIAETGFSRKVLYEGAIDGRLRHRRVPRAGSQPDAFLFDRDELLEDLARRRCAYPGCEKLAPGRSGRCANHGPGAKSDTLELVCQYSQCPRGANPSPGRARGYARGRAAVTTALGSARARRSPRADQGIFRSSTRTARANTSGLFTRRFVRREWC